MTTLRPFVAVVFFLAIQAAGCTPSIGDSCESNSDCDTDQMCDLSQDGGYCTITPCPRTGCPGDSVCVLFDERSSWCMQKCGLFTYCREGYTCVNGFPDPLNPGEVLPSFCNQLEPAQTDDVVAPDDVMTDAGDDLQTMDSGEKWTTQ